MYKTILALILASIVGLSSPSAALSQESAGKPANTVKKGKLTTIKGEVTEVDPAGKSLKVKEKERELTLDVTDKTLVTAGRVKKSVADLQAGDKVVVKFSEQDGKATARSIRMATPGKRSRRGGAKEAPKDAPDPSEEAH